MIEVHNNGPALLSTNFWETEQAKAGKLFVTVNAGTLRLLIPSLQRGIVKELKSAEYVILSRGPWPSERQAEGVELLWEDHSNSPFALHLSTSSFDLLPAEPEAGRTWQLAAYVTGPTKVGEWKCHWRKVPQIPWLKQL